MTLAFDGTVLVPVADPDDGARTAAALAPLLTATSTVRVVHVIEKADGAPDKAGVEQRKEYAAEIFDRVREGLASTDAAVETSVLFGTDVVDRIFEEAKTNHVDAVVFEPREGGLFTDLLTGDVSRRLVKEASVPVVALPRGD
ncbi:universal stress protein [Halopiger djelfimassiliensis]|uniref:universal stress protein n=1 Tax=Halopiger djelfimassiliensis TaxID=1293047 RepID=UPI000677EB88|nr:universal stress protein [Halopiger djelfimassiliensis]